MVVWTRLIICLPNCFKHPFIRFPYQDPLANWYYPKVGLEATARPRFRVVVAKRGGVHKPFVDVAKAWLAREAQADGFTIEYIEDTGRIDDKFLSQFRLLIQADESKNHRDSGGRLNLLRGGEGCAAEDHRKRVASR